MYLSYEKTVTLSVNDLIDETPTDISLSNISFDENIDAESVIATLSTEDNRIIILDSTIHLTNNIPPGESVYTHIDYFLIQI